MEFFMQYHCIKQNVFIVYQTEDTYFNLLEDILGIKPLYVSYAYECA